MESQGVQLKSPSSSTFAPSGSVPPTPQGSGIPEGETRGGGRLLARRTAGTPGPGSVQAEGRLSPSGGPSPNPFSILRPPALPSASLTSGKEPWLYTMSSEVLPQPPSPTITIFSSFLPGPGAAV